MGKRVMKPNSLFGIYSKRSGLHPDYQEMPFPWLDLAEEGEDQEVAEDYYDNLGLEGDEEEEEGNNMEKRTATDFWAARGKKDAGFPTDFWATRG
jgi:hypothetical protein